VKWLKYSLLALIISLFSTAFTAFEHPIVVPDDLGEERKVDSLAIPFRHSEAVKSLVVWSDTLRAESIWRDIIAQDSAYAPALFSLSQLDHISDVEAFDFARRAYAADSMNKWYAEHYGMRLLVRELYNSALDVFKRMLSYDTYNRSLYYQVARIYAIKRMPYSAIAILDTADMRVGRDVYLARFKQDLLFDTHQYDRAIEEGKRLIADLPYDVDAYCDLARAYAKAGRDSLASATYDTAFQIDTTNLGTIMEMWDYYADINNIDRVLELEERILHSNQVTQEAKVERVYDLVDNDRLYRNFYIKVGRLIHILTVYYPTNRTVVELNSLHLYFCGQDELAMEYVHEHLNDSNVTVADYVNAMQLDRVVGDDEQFAADLNRALELYPEDLYIVSLAAYEYHNAGDTKQGIKIFRKALKRVESLEDESALWGTIGDMYYEMGDLKRAFASYDKSLEANPENASALNNYAYFLCLTGERLEEALAMAQLAITIEENDYNYIDTYAWILHLLGRNEEAKKYMLQALSLSGQTDANLVVHYADILWDLGEKFMAETYWKKALSLGYDNAELLRHMAEKKLQSIE
jgi:tetratricopeptide (TPR) repeat protein